MRVFVHHNPEGVIRSVTGFDAPEGVSLMLTPRPGEVVAEVDGHGLTIGHPEESALRDLGKNHKVATPLARCKLVKKF